jgi:hypothetical protein
MTDIGVSRPLSAAPVLAARSAPVFLDATGRRRAKLRWVGRALGLVALAYPLVVVASLIGAPGPHIPAAMARELADGRAPAAGPTQASSLRAVHAPLSSPDMPVLYASSTPESTAPLAAAGGIITSVSRSLLEWVPGRSPAAVVSAPTLAVNPIRA